MPSQIGGPHTLKYVHKFCFAGVCTYFTLVVMTAVFILGVHPVPLAHEIRK